MADAISDEYLLRELEESRPIAEAYRALYLKKVCDFSEIARLPLERGRAPDLSTAFLAYRMASGVGGKILQRITSGKVQDTLTSHLTRRSGSFSDNRIGVPHEDERWRAPISFGTLMNLSTRSDENGVPGRIPVGFYQLDGFLYLPFGENTDAEQITDEFVIPYLGRTRENGMRTLQKALLARFANLRERNNRLLDAEQPIIPVTKWIIQNSGKRKPKMMRKEHLVVKDGTQMALFTRQYLSPQGLDLDTAFLLPRVDVSDRDRLVGQVAEHLKRIDYLNQ